MFRSCPNFPGYSAALCGAVRRDAWASHTKLGKPVHRPATALKRFGPDRRYVYIHGAPVRWERLLADAWPVRVPPIADWLARDPYRATPQSGVA